MSQVQLSEVKAYLPVIHSGDDALLQQLIDAAEQEACRFLDRQNLATLPLEYPAESSTDAPYTEELPSSDDPIAADVRMAVFLLVKGNYRSEPGERDKYRTAAERILMPYRNRIGV